MSFLPITPEVVASIAAIIERARAKPVTWAQAKPSAVPFTTDLTLEARKGMPAIQAREQIEIGSYRCAFSVEEQPAGICWHLSVSVPRPGRVPSPEAMTAIAELFGFGPILKPGSEVRLWLEEFEPGHRAINVLEVKQPREAGHA